MFLGGAVTLTDDGEERQGDDFEIRVPIIIALRATVGSCGLMFQFLSILMGLISACLMLPAMLPLLGWAQWLVLAGCVLGIIFGAFCERKIGLTINVAVGIVAVLRLFLGGGFI